MRCLIISFVGQGETVTEMVRSNSYEISVSAVLFRCVATNIFMILQFRFVGTSFPCGSVMSKIYDDSGSFTWRQPLIFLISYANCTAVPVIWTPSTNKQHDAYLFLEFGGSVVKRYLVNLNVGAAFMITHVYILNLSNRRISHDEVILSLLALIHMATDKQFWGSYISCCRLYL